MSIVYGVGVNDSDYRVTKKINGKTKVCPFYERWRGMLKRCYSKGDLIKYPTYVGCSVDPEWHSFMSFRSWMETQDWKDKHLDKDILFPKNKVYSKHTCVFVTSETNMFLTERGNDRGDCLIGVCWHKRDLKYSSTIQIGGKTNHLGYFDDQMTAHKAWLKKKLELAKELALKQTDNRVAQALIERYNVEVYE